MPLNFADAVALAKRGEKVKRQGMAIGHCVADHDGTLVLMENGELVGDYSITVEDAIAADWDLVRSVEPAAEPA